MGFAPLNIKSHDYVAPTNENYYFSAVIEMSADYHVKSHPKIKLRRIRWDFWKKTNPHQFGMNMEGRGFIGSLNYRFGYQGSESLSKIYFLNYQKK